MLRQLESELRFSKFELNELSFDYLPVAISLAGTSIACLLIFIIGKKIVPKLSLHRVLRDIIQGIIAGPIIVAVAGYGLLLSWQLSLSSLMVSIPTFFAVPNLQLILEIVILVVSLHTAGSIIKKEIPRFANMQKAERLLVYSVYLLGLFVLAYMVLTSHIGPHLSASVWAIIGFMTAITVTYLAVYVIDVIFRHYSADIEKKEGGFKTSIRFLRRLLLSIVALIGVAVATFVSFPSLGAAIASIFVAAGFASIVVGLAAQASLSNIIAGVVISTSQPFKIGDALSYANEWAWVEDIRLTFTILKTWDNRRLVVPNQMFLNSTMVNYDSVDPSKLCIVYVTITFESDMDVAINILKDIARKHPDFLPAGNLPSVNVMDLGDANNLTADANAAPGISLRLLSRAKDQSTNFQMSKDILYSVKKAFDENGIEIAYPRRQIVIDPSPRKTAKQPEK